jgi:hypothetical protein
MIKNSNTVTEIISVIITSELKKHAAHPDGAQAIPEGFQARITKLRLERLRVYKKDC